MITLTEATPSRQDFSGKKRRDKGARFLPPKIHSKAPGTLLPALAKAHQEANQPGYDDHPGTA